MSTKPGVIFIDGASKGNPGPGFAAIVMFRRGRLYGQRVYYLGRFYTNQEAEYAALCEALDIIATNYWRVGTIFTDSKLIVGHIVHGWKVKEKFKKVVEHCKKLLDMYYWKLEWIPREANKAGKLLEKKKLQAIDHSGFWDWLWM